ncbi:integrase, catalytic region, zinc finger, CCHC-type containing protein [Tanacetum coccineum]
MNEFDKFVAEDGESLTSVYERFSTLINIMDRNKVKPFKICINTKLLNSLQPEWSKYVTLTRQKLILEKEHYDVLYDYLSQFEPHVKASKSKKVARNHNPLALVANSHANPPYSHASPSYSHSPQPYYVTHPSSVIDYDDDYQGEIQGDAQEDKLSTAMMLLVRAITQHYSTPTNNRLRTSSNTRNQAVIQDGHVDIQSNNVGYAGNGNRNARRTNRNQATNVRNVLVQKIKEYEQNAQRIPRTESTLGKTNVQCYNCNEKGHYARDFPKPRVRNAKCFREQVLLATKDEAGVNLDVEENNSMLMNAYGDDQLEELNASVNASQIDMINVLLSKSDHDHKIHEKLETVIHTSADDQIDLDIIFDDPYVDNNSGQAKHDPNAHDQPYDDIKSLIYNVQVEAESQRKMNNELKKQKALLQKELETCKELVKEFEKIPVQLINYKSSFENLQKQINVEQD